MMHFHFHFRMIGSFFLLTSSSDPSIGKIDTSLLSAQTLMELFIDSITTKGRIIGRSDNISDIASWSGVKLTNQGEVISIDWQSLSLEGEINLQWLPKSISDCLMSLNQLGGTLDLNFLHEPLRIFSAFKNKFSGTLDLRNLPKTLKELGMGYNMFVGSVCLTLLPDSLEVLHLTQNELTGTIDLTQLPEKLKSLYLSHNDFEGETEFSGVPENIQYLSVSFNHRLSGSIRTSVENQGVFAVDETKIDFEYVLDQ